MLGNKIIKNLLMKNTKNLYKNLVQARSTLALQIKKKAGIYQLVNLKNNKTYIGS